MFEITLYENQQIINYQVKLKDGTNEFKNCIKKKLSAYRVKKNSNNELFKIDDEFIKEIIIYCNKTSMKVKENKKLIKSYLSEQ
jgi:hypothetical protein